MARETKEARRNRIVRQTASSRTMPAPLNIRTVKANTKRNISSGAFKQGYGSYVVYNLQAGLTKQQLRARAETYLGRKLTDYEYRKLRSKRVKSLDINPEKKQSVTNIFGKELRYNKTMEAWRITYS